MHTRESETSQLFELVTLSDYLGYYCTPTVLATQTIFRNFVMQLIQNPFPLTLIGLPLVSIALAYPSSEGTSAADTLFKRAGTTAQLGDYTGSTSSYPDGSGTYVDSKDQGTYASGVKCWTDIVRFHLALFSVQPYLQKQQR